MILTSTPMAMPSAMVVLITGNESVPTGQRILSVIGSGTRRPTLVVLSNTAGMIIACNPSRRLSRSDFAREELTEEVNSSVGSAQNNIAVFAADVDGRTAGLVSFFHHRNLDLLRRGEPQRLLAHLVHHLYPVS